MPLKQFYSTVLFLFFCVLSFAQITNTKVEAKLSHKVNGNVITLEAFALNKTEVYKNLNYKISAIKKILSSNKIIKDSNQEEISLEPLESKLIFKTGIQFNDGEQITFLLLIFEDEQIIGKARVVVNEKNQEDENISELDEFSMLKGIVLDETKTKAGKDFYDMFYGKYLLNKINGAKIVTISEEQSLGRTTIIKVKVEDVIIHQFFSKTQFDYIEEMSKLAIQKVYKYFQDLKRKNQQIIQQY